MRFPLAKFALIFLILFVIGYTVAELWNDYRGEADELREGEYYDYRLLFTIETDEDLETAKLKILSFIRPGGYDLDSVNFTYYGRPREWNETPKNNAIQIDVTKQKYEEIISHLDGLPYTVYPSLNIDPAVQKVPESESEIMGCQEDIDCIKVSGCCGCAGGGRAGTINRGYYEYWEKQNLCEEGGCVAMMSDHWSCFAEPFCINGTCTLVESLPRYEFVDSIQIGEVKTYSLGEPDYEIRLLSVGADSATFNVNNIELGPVFIHGGVELMDGTHLNLTEIFFKDNVVSVEFSMSR